MTERFQTDVLVVGGGGAGFRAAIGAREKGAKVTLVTKGPVARSGASPMAGADLTTHGQGMRAAGFFGEPRDSEETFLNDILHQGCYLNDQRLAEIYVRESPDRLLEMVEWGISVSFTDERAVFTSGTSIMSTLHRQARQMGVNIVGDTAVLDLLVEDCRVAGALALDLRTGDFLAFDTKAVVLATGGWHRAYTPVTGSRELSGDGVAMALRAGAELANMEFVTFCNNVIYWPPMHAGSIFTYVLGLLCGGVLENSDGERVFAKYDPDMVAHASRTEWNKCFISYISAKEIQAGKGSPHDGVFYRVGDEPFEEFAERVRHHYPGWKYHSVDFSMVAEKLASGEGVEVGPAAEYFEGGVAVNERYEATVPGLFAAGECASSPFGANRVAAATMEMLVTGAKAGWSAAEYAEDVVPAAVDVAAAVEAATEPLRRDSGVAPAEVRRRLQAATQKNLGPIRTEDDLKAYLSLLDDMKAAEITQLATRAQTRRYNMEWIEALDLRNMVQVLEASARAALARTESRGVHYRADNPTTDNQDWLKELIVRLNGGEFTIETRPVNVTLASPPEGRRPYLAYIQQMMQGHSDIGGHH